MIGPIPYIIFKVGQRWGGGGTEDDVAVWAQLEELGVTAVSFSSTLMGPEDRMMKEE